MNQLHQNPSCLAETVRNIVMARATAGHVNGESLTATRLACRESARSVLYKGRLSSREAEEVDAIADAARSYSAAAQTYRATPVPAPLAVVSQPMPAVAGPQPWEAPLAAMAAQQAHSETIMASIERLLMALVALLSRGAPAPQIIETERPTLPPAAPQWRQVMPEARPSTALAVVRRSEMARAS